MFINIKRITLLVFLLVVTIASADTETLVPVASPGITLLPYANLMTPVEDNKELNLTVWLRFRNNEQLDQLVNEIYDPSSPNYQKFLSIKQFEKEYAPTKKVAQDVRKYFSTKGLKSKIIGYSIQVRGTAKQIEEVLHVKLNYYNYRTRKVYANANPPTLTCDVANQVLEISGLSDIVHFQPSINKQLKSMRRYKSIAPQEIHMIWDTFVPTSPPTTTSIGGFSGVHLKTAYNLSNIPSVHGTPINGAGQTIIITNECGNIPPSQILAEANIYNSTNGLPPLSAANFAIINTQFTPFTHCNATAATGWEEGIALDLAAAHTIAPNANIVLMLAQNDRDLGAAIPRLIYYLVHHSSTIAGFSNANVVSNAWGTIEGFGYWPIEASFEQAAVSGIGFNYATGNCGDNTYNSPQCTTYGPQPTVQYPASSTFVTAVGGTSMFVDSSWNYGFETVWGTFFNGGFYFGSAGGVSEFFVPSAAQELIKYFFAGGYGQLFNFHKRALPDLAMLGDPITGLTVYSGGSWRTVGGTGLANTLFSATMALVNQNRNLIGKGPIGLAAPYLYTRNSALLHSKSLRIITAPHQIVSGALLPPAGAPKSAFTIFDITFGWDSALTISPESQFWNDAVGVGTPNIANFVPEMATF